MELARSRRNSTSSIQSQGNSSCANVQCSESHTHAIVQKEKDNRIVLVPLDSFINFGKTVKVNEIATFKPNKDSRKADRGKVLLFGTEELCVDQLQVLQDDLLDENQPPEKNQNTKISTLKISNNGKSGQSNVQVQKKNKQNHVMKQSSTANVDSEINGNGSRLDTSSSMPLNTASSINIEPRTHNEDRRSNVKRKLFDTSPEIISKNDSFVEEGETKDRLTTKKSKTVAVGQSSVPRTTNADHLLMSKQITPNDSSSQVQNKLISKSASNHQDGSTENDLNTSNDDEEDESQFISIKKYNNLKQKKLRLEKENEKLEKKLIS